MRQIEVIVAVDGGDSNGSVARAIRPSSQPFRCIIVNSPRPHGEDVPHRNHARNAGCRKAQGEILWVLDADQLMEHGAINSLLEIYDKCKSRGSAPIILFPIYTVKYSPEKWIAHTAQWLNGKENLRNLFDKTQFSGGEWNGFALQYSNSCNSAKSRTISDFRENMPAFPAFLWKALGGFNEKFLYWGGNKEEFTRRLNSLALRGWVETRLITNRRLIHQPHPIDPMRARFDLEPIKKNALRFHGIVNDIDNGADWWIKTTNRVSEALGLNGLSPKCGYSIVCHEPCVEFMKEARKLTNSIDIPLRFIFGRNSLKNNVRQHSWATVICPATDNEVLSIHMGVLVSNFSRIAILDLKKKPNLKKAFELLHKKTNDFIIRPNSGIAIINKKQYLDCGGLSYHAITQLSSALEELEAKGTPEEYKNSVVEFIGDYQPKVPSWVAMGITSLQNKPRISLGIITYNRRDVLEQCVDSLIYSLRPDLFEYDIIISDDCSTDGSREYLESLKHPAITTILNNKRRGVAAQNNRLLCRFDGNVEFGFLSNDDLFFSTGWEELYSYAMARTGYPHFSFMDLALETKINSLMFPPHDIMEVNGVRLVNWRRMRIQGCFVTFNQKVIDLVGGMDAERFRLFGHEHVDWTVRNRRAGLAPGGIRWTSGVYDVLGSHKVLSLNLENYRRSTSPEDETYNTEVQFNLVENMSNRVYLPIDNGIQEEVLRGPQKN